jgi:RimJ/RimL family protein N-acetyltransferase
MLGMAFVFETKRTVVREFLAADIIPFSNYRALPEVAAYQSWSEYTYEDGLALFEQMQGVAFGAAGHWFQLAIIERESEQLLGDLALHFMDGQQVELGFTLDPQFQRQGYGSEAVSGCLTFLFEKLKKHRVHAVTDTENQAAWRLLQRAGFRREAHCIDNVWFKGAWGSEYAYAILAQEWAALKDT